MHPRTILHTVLLGGSLSLLASLAPAAAPDDARLGPLKDLNGYFPFAPPATKADWEARAAYVRKQILVSQGLWPMPTRASLQPVIHGRIELEEYTIDKVYFESAPGLFVTGNLYRPRKITGKVPGVLFAHGHWKDARLSEDAEAKVRQNIATGQERFERGGKSAFQSMCVQLARMGCVVWQWDMLSDSDATQFSAAVIHRFAKQRPEMNTRENWGLFSPQAEARLQSVMGLQTWNATRSLDFLLSLPEVDPGRIAITGASGGGTQTMLLAAIDERVKLSFPAVMVSTAMQGGCTCENASLLRVNTGNVEFAALFAPKPQGMTTANDWTKEMSTKGFPQLQELYKLVGAPKDVMLHRGEHFPHNYNAVSRSGFFTFLNSHFRLGQQEPVIERDYEPLSREQLTVWDAAHPAPKADDADFERRLLRWFAQDADQQLRALVGSPARFREVVGAGVEVTIGRTLARGGEVQWKPGESADRDVFREAGGRVRNTTYGEEVPVVWLQPRRSVGRAVLWLGDDGKAALRGGDGALRPEVRRLLEAGVAVIGADLLYQGEFLAGGQPLARTRVVENPREAPCYTFGYNHALFAQRAHDVLTLVRLLRTGVSGGTPMRVSVVGLGGVGPIVAAARAVAGTEIEKAVVETGGFRFSDLLDYRDPRFLPGGAKYLDVPGLLALSAPQPLWVSGEGASGSALARDVYRAAGAESQLRASEGSGAAAASLAWLLE